MQSHSGTMILFVGTEKRREKVVVLRELQRTIIYTRELSKQAIEDHVSTAFIVYSVNEGARLTPFICRSSHHQLQRPPRQVGKSDPLTKRSKTENRSSSARNKSAA
jgi:hypothetical protein